MKIKTKNILAGLVATAFLFTSCNEDEILKDWIDQNQIEEPVDPGPLTGSAGTELDLSNLVVLGTSLGAGFQDGALYSAGQANSFAALIGAQLQAQGIGGTTDFGQPDINSVNGYNMLANDGTSGKYVLSLSAQAPVTTTGEIASILTPWGGTTSTLNNFSVPLAQSPQLVVAATGGPVTDTYGGAVPAANNPAYNPFYRRFASNPSADGSSGSTPLTDALSAGGTFYIYEAGINDIALWAAGGGTTAIGPMTDAGTFGAVSGSAIQALTTAGGTSPYGIEGVVLTVPPILVFPFFQAVQWNAITLDAATAETLNTSFASVNGAIDGAVLAGWSGAGADARDARKVTYAEGKNPILVVDSDLDDLGPYWDALVGAEQMSIAQRTQLEPYRQSRPMVAGEYVPLSTGAVLGTEADGDDTEANTPLGVAIPLGFDLLEGELEPLAGDQYYITVEEAAEINLAISDYNTALSSSVDAMNSQPNGNVILVDIGAIFLDAAGLSDGVKGITTQGVTYTPDFLPNGIFSTDGIHPCQRGHGIIANAIINAINANYAGANIPEVTVQALSFPPYQL